MKSSLEGHLTPTSPALQQNAAQREELLDAYFTDTQLLHVLQSFLKKLATNFKTKRVLPANPYPELLVGIRQSEIQRSLVLNGAFSQVIMSPELIMHGQQKSISPQFCLCSTTELLARSLWGVQDVVERIVDAVQLVQRVDGIQTMHPCWFSSQDDQNDDQYRVIVFTALVGDGNGFSLEQCPVVEIEQHVVVTGELLENAMAVFARQLFKFLHQLTSNSSTMGCIGVSITPSSSSGDSVVTNGSESQMWTPGSVSANRNAFAAVVKIAIVGNASFEISSFSSTSTTSRSANSINNSSSDSQLICQTRQRFFFHFVWEPSTATTMKPTKAPQQQQQNRSFLTGTQILESGLFLSAQGALEITSRVQRAQDATKLNVNGHKFSISSKQQQPQTSNTVPGLPSSFSLCSTSKQLVGSFLETLSLPTSPQEIRKWTNCFTNSFGCALLTFVLRNQVLIDLVMETQINNTSLFASRDILKAHFETFGSQLEVLLEQARVGSTSSLLKSVEAFMRTLWTNAQTKFQPFISDSCDSVEEFSPIKLTEPLETVNELLLVIARIAVRDFIELVRSQTLVPGSDSTFAQEDNPQGEQIDVLRALQTAVDERVYPPIVALECVLAQLLVDSCVDMALESAVLNIVAAHLPPNPFVELSHHVRVFALRQHVWSRPLSPTSSKGNKTQVQAHKDSEVLLTKAGTNSNALYGVNHSLLEAIDPLRVGKAHQWLQQHGVFRKSDFQPSKSSYSIQISHSLMVFHPTAFATRKTNQFLHELEIVEHVVIEGREFVQALAFFADAVAHDLRRLSGLELLLFPIQVEVRGPMDDLVSEVDHHLSDSDSEMALLELVREAMRTKCVLRVQLTLFTASSTSRFSGGDAGEDVPRLHIVGKSYLFHHKPTESDSQTQQCVSKLLTFRLKQFGVFFAPETVELMLELKADSFSAGELPPEFWTPLAHQALLNDDLLLKYELDFGSSKASAYTTRYHATDDHKSGILLQRLTAHTWILQLYSIETACLWLLRHLEQRQHSAKSHNAISVSMTRALEALLCQVERTLLPLNAQMRYVERPEELLTTFQQLLSKEAKVANSPGRPGELYENKSLGVMEKATMRMLRQTWLLVLYTRFSYQQDFFANY